MNLAIQIMSLTCMKLNVRIKNHKIENFKGGKKNGNGGLPVGVLCMKGPLSATVTLSSPLQKPKQPMNLYLEVSFNITG